MYIKSISIHGFRSYRERTVIDNISRQFNVVVGQNGSGKSNFFAAISFVLSSDFAHLTQENRQALLHEGTGNPAATATVELLFDNSDRRLAAIENSEFTISRTISIKKDQYFIDGRVSLRTEIINLMESAGFSRSNPYYIVKQGKIAELATATDLARLKLLREVAGTRVYDDKKQESLKMLVDTKGKMERSEQLLEFMNKRLETLESEKEELKEYQKHDKLRRALEYTLLKNEASECKKRFDNFSMKRQELQHALNEAETEKFNYSKEIIHLESELRKLEVREKRLATELQQIREEENKLECAKTMAELESKDLREQVNLERESRQASEEKLREIERTIQSKEKELKEIHPRFTKLIEEQAEILGEIEKIKRKRTDLYFKSGKGKVYNSIEERDRELRLKIHNLNQRIAEVNDNIRTFEEAHNEEMGNKDNATTRIQEIEQKIEENISTMDRLTAEDEDLRGSLDRATKILHEKQTEHKNINDRLAELEAQYDHVETSFYHMLAKSTSEGIRNINTIIEDLKQRNTGGQFKEYIEGYHGIVIKLMSADQVYYRALEVTAGSSLTHHVVENERIAMFFLEEIQKRHMKGQCTFFALNRVYAPEQRPLRDKDGRHLLSVVKYSEKFSPVFRHMFGGTILVKNITTGRKIARNEQFNCITFEGDEVNCSGPMTGGFVDTRKSRLDVVKNLTTLEPTLRDLKSQAKHLSRECSQRESELGNLRLKVSNNEQERSYLQRGHNDITTEKRELFELNNRSQRNAGNREQQIVEMKHTLKELEVQKEELQAQIGVPLATNNGSQDSQKIAEIEALFKQKSAAAEKIIDQVSEIKNRKMKLENELSVYLYRQREDLKMKLSTIDLEVKRHELQTRSVEAEKTQKRAAELYARIIEIQEELTEVRETLQDYRSKLDKLNDAKAEADNRVSNCASEIEQIRNNMTECNKKREDTLRKIKDLGALPVDITTQFGNARKKDLDAQWAESCNHLKKFTNVNKKALDQFVRSAADRDSLQEQIKEMADNYERINTLIESTEKTKFDTLYLTFKQVAKNFHDVFKKLVPSGIGDLVMKTAPVDHDNPEAVQMANASHVMERFIGVGIRVNFNDTTNEGCRELFHLSGGQKTLVALALIFAIQKCDPAPFYLFDEIDAALDQEKRKAVAKLIDEFSSTGQFIATTFRPEMLEHANKCYGVRFRNKVSYITQVHPEEALEFLSLDDNLEEEETFERMES